MYDILPEMVNILRAGFTEGMLPNYSRSNFTEENTCKTVQ